MTISYLVLQRLSYLTMALLQICLLHHIAHVARLPKAADDDACEIGKNIRFWCGVGTKMNVRMTCHKFHTYR